MAGSADSICPAYYPGAWQGLLVDPAVMVDQAYCLDAELDSLVGSADPIYPAYYPGVCRYRALPVAYHRLAY